MNSMLQRGRATTKQNLTQIQEVEVEKYEGSSLDPPEREKLPFFKDPKVKISIWTILKDSIGKELSKITVPVYFNEPLGIL
jgi:hypothetical protein